MGFAAGLIRREYDCSFAADPKVIIDGGANIGTASIFNANRYPGARIYAIEPDPSNFDMLQKNTRNYLSVSGERCGMRTPPSKSLLLKPSLIGESERRKKEPPFLLLLFTL